MRRSLAILFCLGALLHAGGCINVPAPQQRLKLADQLAHARGWQRQEIDVPPFILTAYLPASSAAEVTTDDGILTIYIEGDGLAWISRAHVSDDPTPVDPIGLKLALRHPASRVAYLARPCQYAPAGSAPGCSPKVWTTGRFSPEVIAASDAAITGLKQQTGASALRLIGYSGGGAVAALVAARRTDVCQLITVAGNLDHVLWTATRRISPLVDSLNPADAWASLKDIPQAHLVGEDDHVVGEKMVQSYQEHFPAESPIKTLRFPGYTHQCCWADNWPASYFNVLMVLESEAGSSSP